MFSKNKKQKAPTDGARDRSREMMNQMGITDFESQLQSMAYGPENPDEDAELMAELYRLEGKNVPKKVKREDPRNQPLDLDKLQAFAQVDVDIEISDTEDPELEDELNELMGSEDEESPQPVVPPKPKAPAAPPQREVKPQPAAAAAPKPAGSLVEVLQQRIVMYQQAISNAKEKGESSKVRRYERAYKTLNGQLKLGKAGKPVPTDEIPPIVHTGSSDQQPQPAAAPASPPAALPSATEPSAGVPVEEARQELDTKTLAVLEERKEQFRQAAAQSKQMGNNQQAVKYLSTAKQFDKVIDALKRGDPIDLSQMPPPPPSAKEMAAGAIRQPERTQERSQGRAMVPEGATGGPSTEEPSAQEEADFFNAPEAPSTAMEALQQRMAKYRSTLEEAQQKGDSGRERRMKRIIKQYEDAIKLTKAGKPCNYEELPTPPGFPPIPAASAPARPAPTGPTSGPPRQVPAGAAAKSAATAAAAKPAATAAAKSPAGGPHPRHSGSSYGSQAEKTTQFLKQRQLAYRKAAADAKRNGNIELAKKHLTYSHGFDKMIQASEAGIPVDMSQVPPDPFATETGVEVSETIPGGEEVTGDRNEVYKRLEQDLISQIRVCSTNSDHYQKLGDIASSARFDQMNDASRKDLDALRSAFKHGDPVPRFHYENRTFSLLQRCPELGDDMLELTFCRGIDYPLPSGFAEKDLDTYIKFEFPFPNDNPQCGETPTVKNSANPEYNHTLKLEIKRSSRAFQRVIKSKMLKCEVYYKRGFLKSDKVLANVQMKLQGLENKCVLHESVPLIDEKKKSVGGSLQIQMRIRDPIFSKQIEQKTEKWLVIDSLHRPQPAASRPNVPMQGTIASGKATSIQVLKFEKQLIDKQLKQLAGKLTSAQQQQLEKRGDDLVKQASAIESEIKSGGAKVYKAYCSQIESSASRYAQEARQASLSGKDAAARNALLKKKLVEEEAAKIRKAIK